MSELAVEVERRIQLHGSADTLIELFDNWEGMGLLSIRFGAHDGEGGISWADEGNIVDVAMARVLAEQLIDFANRKAWPLTAPLSGASGRS